MDARSISMKPVRRVVAVEAEEAPVAAVEEAPVAAGGEVEAAAVDPVRGESPAGNRRKERPAG
jgi:hypothetical protein